MKVKLNELKYLCEVIIDRAVIAGIDEIELDTDNYWIITSDERENFTIDNPRVCVGSLFDDLENLMKVKDGSSLPTTVDFDRLASVIIAIGERISRSDKLYI